MIISPSGQRMNPPIVLAYFRGIVLFFYSGKAPTRLFAVRVAAVKPFDDVVAGHTTQNSNNKRSDKIHPNTSSYCQVLVGQHNDYNMDCLYNLEFSLRM